MPDSHHDDHPPLPLTGVRILDLTRAMAGPYCTALLGDLGADIVKIEPLGGDMAREWNPMYEGTSLYAMSANRNKRSICIDMHSSEGKTLLRRLSAHADVIVENFRPGVLDRLGIGPAWLRENRPDLILASITGFGPVGPLRDEPCFDQIAQGVGGLMSVTGTTETGPMRAGIPLADILSGMFAATAVCASLAGAARTGRTSAVETSLLESVLGVLTFQAQRYLTHQEIPQPTGNEHPVIAPYGVYPTQDGHLNLAVGTPDQWRRFARAIDAAWLIDDPRFSSIESRNTYRDALRHELEHILKAEDTATWLIALRKADIPAGPINDLEQVFHDPQVLALDVIQEIDHPTLGRQGMVRGPLRIEGQATPIRLAPPALGEHSWQICQEAGLSTAEIEALIAAGVVTTADV